MTSAAVLLVAAAAVPAAGALVAAVLGPGRRPGRTVTVGTGLATVVAVALLVLAATADDGVVEGAGLRIDRAMALLLVVVVGTATVVTSFSERSLDSGPRAVRFFAAMGALVAGSVLVIVAGRPVPFASGWLLAGWSLVVLVGHRGRRPDVERARRRILAALAIGDAALVLALVLATLRSDGILVDGPAAVEQLRDGRIAGIPAIHVVAVLLVVAGLSRSALVPFHRWLVGTLVAPTPVSAIVHAGVVSGAGLLFVRLVHPVTASGPAIVLAFVAATVTVILASAASIARPDVKGALAWSTVAQMSFMVLQCTVGAFSSAVVHIAGHGMYKAALFLGAGDTVSASVRAARRPAGATPMSPWLRRATTVAVPTAAVALAVWWFPPLVPDAGRVLVVVFAWATLVSTLSGWLRRRPYEAAWSASVGTVVTLVSAVAYFAALRAAEHFMKPSLEAVDTAIGPAVVIAVLVVIAVGAALLAAPGPLAGRARRAGHRVVVAATSARPIPRLPRRDDPERFVVREVGADERVRIRGDVAQAGALVAPMWPLSSFVAVNPLGGMEGRGFDAAAATARRWLRARTHLTLDEYRADHERGLTRLADLEYVVHERYAELCARPPMEIAGRLVAPVDLIVADLLHGPEPQEPRPPRTALERAGLDDAAELVDDLLAGWIADWVAHRAAPGGGERFVARCRRLAAADPRLGGLLSPSGLAWLADLPDDAAVVLASAVAVAGVEPDARVDEVRGHLGRLPGWSGLAKWRNEWAQPDETRPAIAPIEVVAVRAALEAAVLGSVDPAALAPSPMASDPAPELLAERVASVAAVLAPGGVERDLDAIASVLRDVPAGERPAIWLRAQERHFDDRILSVLDRVDPGARVDRPDAQVAFCIDVRSEGLRRHLEETGDIETLGFAGFFGVPLSVRRVGWERPEPRCPVLVAPSVPAVEQPRPGAIPVLADHLRRERGRAGVQAAHAAAKHDPGAPFALAEGFGWILGPRAAVRTLLPGRAGRPAERHTSMQLDESVLVEQRIFAAESVLRTMGLVERFAPVVLLCGHTSRTVNNPHASALDCGACAGAAGDDNAMAVAALLNAPDVRLGLAERGIEIPDDTWFAAGLHDTASDHVTILDAAAAPVTHADRLGVLQARLDRAGTAQAAARSRHLPGPARRVRDRGADWAQVRPEWGLARAAAFVIGPRSLTAGIDLDGRAFLHGYDAIDDPTGRVLETIMTAPLVVAHWISSQYYFSTVDPEVFGAGDKLVHNPIGSVGVVSGDGGDLRVGLPLQSTHVADRRHHQPVRLLAVIQADLERIEEIIGRHQILQTLVAGSWLRIAARSHPHEPWSTRTPAGTWITDPRPLETRTTLATTETEPTNPVELTCPEMT